MLITKLMPILVIAILIVLMVMIARDSKRSHQTITLEEGAYAWDVYSNGERQVWKLAYSSYDELPIHNQNYGDFVIYRGVKYEVWRVYSNQIQLSASIAQ